MAERVIPLSNFAHHRKNCEECGVRLWSTARGKLNAPRSRAQVYRDLEEGWGHFCNSACRDRFLDEALQVDDKPITLDQLAAVAGISRQELVAHLRRHVEGWKRVFVPLQVQLVFPVPGGGGSDG